VSGTIARTLEYRIYRLLGEDEFCQVINREQLHCSKGLLGKEGVNVPFLLALLDAVLEEEGRSATLELVSKRYKTELRQMLSEALPKITLEWSEGFEKWLIEKKSKPISEGPCKCDCHGCN